MTTSSSSPSQPTRSSTQPSSSPFESPSSSGMNFASPRTLHLVDITYPESYMRTPLPTLPFTAPRWLLEYGRSVGGCILELEDDDDDDEVDTVRESIEPREEVVVTKKDIGIWGNGKREWIGYTNTPSKRKRRCESSEEEITSVHAVQKLKRS